MRALIISNGIVSNAVEADEAWVAANGAIFSDIGNIGDLYDGANFIKPPPPTPTQAQLVDAVQGRLDKAAKTRHYDSALSCASYAASANATFAAEAAAMIAWRDSVWAYCYTQLAAVQSSARPAPATVAAFLAELPPLIW